jgi:hypothetical protein
MANFAGEAANLAGKAHEDLLFVLLIVRVAPCHHRVFMVHGIRFCPDRRARLAH